MSTFGSFGSWIAAQLVQATDLVSATAFSSMAAPQLRQLKPAAFARGPSSTGRRSLSSSSSNDVNAPMKSSGGASL